MIPSSEKTDRESREIERSPGELGQQGELWGYPLGISRRSELTRASLGYSKKTPRFYKGT